MATILEMQNISKTYPGVRALDNVNLRVQSGEIHAICGENGAGKSTLMKVLSGVIPHGSYQGDIIYDGEPRSFARIADSEHVGIIIIHQELALVPLLSIAENIFLGNETANKIGVIDWGQAYARTRGLLAKVGLREAPNTLITDLGIGKQQPTSTASSGCSSARCSPS
jgi:putative multiple sugar transport system ATP-binding protein